MRFATLGLLAALIAGCAAPTAPRLAGDRPAPSLRAKEASASLYPLSAGSRWTYRLLQQQDDGPVREKPMTMRVLSAQAGPDGATEAVVEREYESWKPPLTRALAYADRVVLGRLSDPIGGPSITILKFPLEAGATWPGRPLTGGNSETIAPMGLERVTVPAGAYEAQRVDHRIVYANGATDTLHYWYAPGVGVVKMIERSTLFSGDTPVRLQVTGELTAYEAGRQFTR